jgi:cephalosporin hydroxylase
VTQPFARRAGLADRLVRAVYRRPRVARFLGTQFHKAFYYTAGTWRDARWLGTPLLKCPLDLWVYQEILCEVRPDVIVESGTYRGGSALFLASVCDLLGHGRVVTIDPHEYGERPQHPRITYVRGSSTAPDTLTQVRARVTGDERGLVVLDSDHAAAHVLEELRMYGPLVAVGSYLIVEDTNVNGHPVVPEHGPGPMEAVEQFLGENPAFTSDRSREKFYLTSNPAGYLRRLR